MTKFHIIIVDPEKARTLQGAHARVYLDEAEARRYQATAQTIPTKKVTIDL